MRNHQPFGPISGKKIRKKLTAVGWCGPHDTMAMKFTPHWAGWKKALADPIPIGSPWAKEEFGTGTKKIENAKSPKSAKYAGNQFFFGPRPRNFEAPLEIQECLVGSPNQDGRAYLTWHCRVSRIPISQVGRGQTVVRSWLVFAPKLAKNTSLGTFLSNMPKILGAKRHKGQKSRTLPHHRFT